MPPSDTGKPKMSPEQEQKGFSVVHRRQMGTCHLLLPLCWGLLQMGMGCLGRALGWWELLAALGATEGNGAASQGIAEPREALVGSILVGESLYTLWNTFPLSHLFPASKPKCRGQKPKCRWTAMETKVPSAPAPAHIVPALSLTPATPLGACFEPLLAFLSPLASPLSLKLSHLFPKVFPTLSADC